VVCGSRSDFKPEVLDHLFDEVGNVKGVPVFMQKQLGSHFKGLNLTIDLTERSGLRNLTLKMSMAT
jgi:hypothetical protein